MIKITDQYFWNFVFLAFFGFLLIMATIILDTESRIPLSALSKFDLAVIILASWRLTRLFSSDTTTKFFREQFYDLKKTTRTITLEKPVTGPRRTILDIILSPWSFGIGMTALVTFCYLISAYTLYVLLLLALSGLVALLEVCTQYLTTRAKEE
jgi:Protein of unknown function (DUF1360)